MKQIYPDFRNFVCLFVENSGNLLMTSFNVIQNIRIRELSRQELGQSFVAKVTVITPYETLPINLRYAQSTIASFIRQIVHPGNKHLFWFNPVSSPKTRAVLLELASVCCLVQGATQVTSQCAVCLTHPVGSTVS